MNEKDFNLLCESIRQAEDKRFVEWTSRKPIAEMQTDGALASNDWRFPPIQGDS
jgi:hypothetical protein